MAKIPSHWIPCTLRVEPHEPRKPNFVCQWPTFFAKFKRNFITMAISLFCSVVSNNNNSKSTKNSRKKNNTLQMMVLATMTTIMPAAVHKSLLALYLVMESASAIDICNRRSGRMPRLHDTHKPTWWGSFLAPSQRKHPPPRLNLSYSRWTGE